MADRVYKSDLPRLRGVLLEMKSELSKIEPSTDWVRLRVDTPLRHVELRERLAPSLESSDLRGGVPLLHSDLVYFRANVDGLRRVLASERRWSQRRRESR